MELTPKGQTQQPLSIFKAAQTSCQLTCRTAAYPATERMSSFSAAAAFLRDRPCFRSTTAWRIQRLGGGSSLLGCLLLRD
ncbi:MAG: hypothetical protein IPH31_18240 [Lewinellaceae bacterium]|nr:hypothetical protein [Lewinellaceae bacterium]